MPLHTIGLSQPRSFYGLTFADLMSCVIAFLFYAQPGVDHKAVFQWIIDNAFGGSVALVAIAGTFISHKILEWCGLLWFEAMYQLDKRKHLPGSKAIASMKIDTDTPWAWDSPDSKVDTKYKDLKRKSLKYIVTFHAIVSVVQFGMIYFATQWKRVDGQWTWSWLPDHPDYVRADANLIPSKATVAYQCLVSLFISESGFYFAHRLMHETRLYYWHKRHHEFKESTAYAAFYVGFFDALITDLIPAGGCIIYFEMHQWTIWMFTIPVICNSLRVHCGYDCARLLGFNPMQVLPFCTDTERTHDIHHRTNMCNYGGAYFFLDRLFGTFRSPDDEIAERAAGKLKKVAQQPYDGPAEPVAPAPADEQSTSKLKAS